MGVAAVDSKATVFKYISCYGSRASINCQYHLLSYLNTSHVMVQGNNMLFNSSLNLYLNTSHVMVQADDIRIYNPEIKLFKYISCYGSRFVII